MDCQVNPKLCRKCYIQYPRDVKFMEIFDSEKVYLKWICEAVWEGIIALINEFKDFDCKEC